MIYDLRLDFAFNNTNNKMRISLDDQEIIPIAGKGTLITKIQLPCTLWLKIYGKNENKDTIIDNDIVIKDRHIRLVDVLLNGVRPASNFIRRWPQLHVGGRDRNQKIYSHYWGFNGEIELDFNERDLLSWLMSTNKFRDDDWHKNYD